MHDVPTIRAKFEALRPYLDEDGVGCRLYYRQQQLALWGVGRGGRFSPQLTITA